MEMDIQQPGAKHQFLEYDLHCNRNGDAACSCPDFQIHGGACKHLRALRLTIEHWISQQLEMPFHFPISREEAEKLRLEWMIESNNDAATGSHGGLGGIPEFPVPQVVQWDPTPLLFKILEVIEQFLEMTMMMDLLARLTISLILIATRTWT